MSTLSPALIQQVAAIQAELDAKNALIRRDAESRFEALVRLDADMSARRELRAAGVSETRVFALYPFGMDQLVDATISAIERQGLSHLDGSEAWTSLDESNYNAKKRLPESIQNQLMDDLMEALEPGGYYARLGKCVRSSMQGVDADDRASGLIRALLYACWMMLNLSKVPAGYRYDTLDYFALVMQWTLPALSEAKP